MRIRIFQLLSILVVIFSSCSELDEKNGYIAGTPELHDTIYQARNPNLPCVKTRRIDYGKLMFTRASANEDKNGNLGELRVSCISPWMPTTCLTKKSCSSGT